MLQERKPRFCGILATFFQSYFMSEAQVLMTVSDFWGGFFWELFPGRWLYFSFGRDLVFSWVGPSILKGEVAHLGHWFWWEERFLKNIIWWRVQSPALYGKPWHTCTTNFKIINIDIMECSVVMECIYNVDACKIPALLCYIANKLFGQQ